MIPYGTEIQIGEVDEAKVSFRDVAAGKDYTIIYKGSWLLPPVQKERLVSFWKEPKIYIQEQIQILLGYKTALSKRYYQVEQPMTEFLKAYFTSKDRDALEDGLGKDILKKTRKGVFDLGMTKREVMLSCGYPPASRTPQIDGATWIYQTGPFLTYRLIFNKDKVLEILHPE